MKTIWITRNKNGRYEVFTAKPLYIRERGYNAPEYWKGKLINWEVSDGFLEEVFQLKLYCPGMVKKVIQ